MVAGRPTESIGQRLETLPSRFALARLQSAVLCSRRRKSASVPTENDLSGTV
jgi:hypothetical protein